MVRRILEQEKAIQYVVGTDYKTCHHIPTWQDIDVLQSVDSAVKDLVDLLICCQERIMSHCHL